MLAVQEKIDLIINTPLGKDMLILDKLDGVEQISAPFCFSLEMHSTSPSLDLSALVGKEVQITFQYKKEKRYFCGIVGTAEQGWTVRKENNNFTFYQAKIYPKFWLLKFTRDYRIFQNKSALDIIKLILKENGVTEIQDKTSSCGKGIREYCVQYGESCFDFVSRLMEEEGIFYFFTHTSSTHKMVLADDSKGAEDTKPGNVKFLKSYSDSPMFNVLHTIRSQEQVVPKKFAATDFNFKTPTLNLYNKVSGQGAGGEVYEYPGIYMKTNEGDLITNHRLQNLEWAKITLMGFSTVPSFCPMHAFTMEDHPRPSLNKKHVLYQVYHRISQNTIIGGEDIYENEFISFPATVIFRPERVTLKPLIHSTQTAIVTTKSGEEIWCDEYGRIKVHFHWDQRGPKDEKSSCWIRVAQLWAGNNWGGLFTPRIGMEVVVTFLDGDPDRPLITGCVYNGKHASPYSKSNPTRSTIKSDSTKGGGGFNEFRFEDKKGSEEIYTHAQKDQNTVVEHTRTLLIKTGDDKTDINKGQRTVTLKGEETGHDTLTLKKGNRTVNLDGSGTTHMLKILNGNNIINITKGNQITKITQGSNTIVAGKGDSVTNVMQGNIVSNIAQGNSVTSVGQGNLVISVGAGNLAIQVNGNISISASGSISISGGGGVAIKGPSVSIG